MKRRIGVIVATLVALSAAGTAGAQALLPERNASHWGCVGVQAIDTGVCVSNPLPQRLPIPDTPSVPSPV